MKIKRMVISLLIFAFVPALSFSQNFSDYLILHDIGPYKLEAPQKVVGGYIGGPRVFDGAGVIAPTGHFYFDHTDKTYEAYYEGESILPSATVQVTQHAGSDSDKWLMHEVEDSYRSDEMSRLGLLSKGAIIKTVDNKRYFSIRLGGGSYMWISNNVVVRISYRSIQGGKPEPNEVIQAYLQKFPSTIPTTLTLDRTHDIQWIKDEMDRRLWLCDKWFMQLQLKKAEEKQVYQESVKSMNIFLDYREKYYGIKAANEKNLLAGYLNMNNGTSIKAKLTEYKNWWSAHKTDATSL